MNCENHEDIDRPLLDLAPQGQTSGTQMAVCEKADSSLNVHCCLLARRGRCRPVFRGQ